LSDERKTYGAVGANYTRKVDGEKFLLQNLYIAHPPRGCGISADFMRGVNIKRERRKKGGNEKAKGKKTNRVREEQILASRTREKNIIFGGERGGRTIWSLIHRPSVPSFRIKNIRRTLLPVIPHRSALSLSISAVTNCRSVFSVSSSDLQIINKILLNNINKINRIGNNTNTNNDNTNKG
jgi:hypothetical protein